VKVRRWLEERNVGTLMQAHEALVGSMPAVGAAPKAWLTYHQHATEVYTEIADLDGAHYYEALACAGVERDKATDIAQQIEQVAESG
jgi:hypothetical protein